MLEHPSTPVVRIRHYHFLFFLFSKNKQKNFFSCKIGNNVIGADNQQGSLLVLKYLNNDPSTTTRRTTINFDQKFGVKKEFLF